MGCMDARRRARTAGLGPEEFRRQVVLAAGLVWGIVAMMLTDTAGTFAVGASSFFVTVKLLEASFYGVMCSSDNP